MKKDKEYKREGMERREFLKLIGSMGGASALYSLPFSSHAAAKEIYPAEDITFVCYSQPGGGYDLSARGAAPFLSKALREVSPGAKGGNVKVKNMTGGAGAKAAYYLFKDARPDGYTIGDINRGSFYKFLVGKDKLPFDVRDFTYLYSLTTVNRVLVSGKRSGITSWETMLAKSKKEPLKWAISTVGGSEHLDTIYVKETTGIQATLSTWGGSSTTEGALIRGDADITLVSYDSMKSLIDAGEINILVTFTAKRILPNVPTIVEKGFPKIPNNVGGLGGKIAIAPPNLDPEAKRILVAAARKMVVDPGYLDFCKKAEIDLDPLFEKDLDNLIRGNIKFYMEMAPTYKKYGL
jgi:putative tricarboxylic transport membrane protein